MASRALSLSLLRRQLPRQREPLASREEVVI